MLESKSFNVHINTVVLIIAMLGYSKINTKISNIGIETTESNNCREVLEDDCYDLSLELRLHLGKDLERSKEIE